MENDEPGQHLEPEASELLLCTSDQHACETYVFDPSAGEESLGHLYAVGEVEDRGGVGKELLDLVVQALQREYYREPSRGVLASFESGLHQANLVLHDAAEQGVREWMGSWHVAVSVLAGATLHISTSGNASVFLVRRSRVTLVSRDLAHSPITDPLRTFSQVASGTVMARDILYLGGGEFNELFRREDLARFSAERSASTISTRLQQLYADQGSRVPLVAVVISALPQHMVAAPHRELVTEENPERRERGLRASLTPRKPLVIHRSVLRSIGMLLVRSLAASGAWLRDTLWPLLVSSSRHSGRALKHASVATGKGVRAVAQRGGDEGRLAKSGMMPARERRPLQENIRALIGGVLGLPERIRIGFRGLPRTSKLFAIITLVLALSLVVSLVFLRAKRVEDAAIQQASEVLHDAQTKQSAAETALIYDNRDQARSLVTEAASSLETLLASGFYVQEAEDLRVAIVAVTDRLQKVVRGSTADVREVGDFASALGEAQPTHLTFVNGGLYTSHPATNAIVRMAAEDGAVATVADTSQGIGFLQEAVPHEADKSVVFITDEPGVAIFDTKDNTLTKQEINLNRDESTIEGLATFGNRLYVLDRAAQNIFSFSKSLRGYSSGVPWITDESFPRQSMVSVAVDGSVYTLQEDGSVRELFKGEEREFTTEPVEPSLAGADKLITTEGMINLYVFDQANKRVVIFGKDGTLERQLLLDIAQELSDVTIAADEETLYVLDGTRVLAVPLVE